MDRAMRCTGYVLRGIAVGLGIMAAFAAGVAFLVWVSTVSAKLFGLDDKFSLVFALAYVAAVLGALAGVEQCRRLSHSRPASNGEAK